MDSSKGRGTLYMLQLPIPDAAGEHPCLDKHYQQHGKKVVETTQKVNTNSNVNLGANLRSGNYTGEIMQGSERKRIKLIKTN